MIIPLNTISLTDEQLDVARGIAVSEVNDVAANMEIFSDSLRRTYLFRNFDLMKCFDDYLKANAIPASGQGLDKHRLQELFYYYHTMGNED